MPQFKALIFDIGDVLFSWTPPTTTGVPPKTLKAILSSDIWFDYEQGCLSEEDCYSKVGERFSIDSIEVARTFSAARDSLQPDNALKDVIFNLKEKFPGLAIYAMSNISKPDYAALRSKDADWSLFDAIFTSGHIGMRKPNLCFYRHVITAIGVCPKNIIFIDDNLSNIISAQSIGMHAILYKGRPDATRNLRNLLEDPIQRGENFLNRNAKCLHSVTNTDIIIWDNISQLLILEATHNEDLIAIEPHEGKWNFFIDSPQLTTDSFPDDLNTTSVACMALKPKPNIVNSIQDEMLEYVNADGIIMTYFDHTRPRIDPIVAVNVLRLFYESERQSQLTLTMGWIYDVLLFRAYLQGTRYYSTAEAFLYFTSCLNWSSNNPTLQPLRLLLVERLKERVGAKGDALCLAMRLLACKTVGLMNVSADFDALLSMQCEDGGWDPCWIYRYGTSGIEIGNRGLTTAFAVKAIREIGPLRGER